MQSAETDLQAANALLEYGMEVQVTAPLLFRLFGKRALTVVVPPPFMGTIYRISRINSKAGITTEVSESLESMPVSELHDKYSWPMAKVAATAILNGYFACMLFTLPFAAWLRWHLKPWQLNTIATAMNLLNGKKAFTDTIRSSWGMQITTPNLSQANQGS